MDDTDGWEIDSDLSFEPMASLGWSIDMLSWRSEGIDWDAYDAVYICTPWDYPDDADAFLALLETIDRSGATLVNDIALVRWTIPKTYLRDLELRGAVIVPSLWYDSFDAGLLSGFFDAHQTDRIIIKPVVSTNAHNTFLIDRDVPAEVAGELEQAFAKRPFVVQPFIESVQREGEYSLFFFCNEYSHAILKIPKDADFRVQEEHGARIVATEPERELLRTAADILELVQPMPMYARCDFLRGPDGRFLLMRFARAFDAYVARSRAAL
jgi:glutathione synthase/RimK-type ligase-like ATP-grasp enzyme